MAETTLLLNGFSVIGDPHTNSAAAGGGRLMIHGGKAVFQADDIVVYTVANVAPNGVLTGNSYITGVTVYDNATAYYNDTPLYSYSGRAEIDAGRNSMGDRYLEFNARGLTSTDANAPVLGQMAVVAGVDVLGTLATTKGPLRIQTQEDIDLNGDGIISDSERGDGAFSSDLNVLTMICFARGTLIETPAGLRPVETLKRGDAVNTLDNGPKIIRWAGAKEVSGQGATAPVQFAAGAIGNIRALLVSQNHRLLITGTGAELMFGDAQVLVAAKHLVNCTTIRIRPCTSISYHHFLFDAHEIVFAEGCPAESLYPGEQALNSVDTAARDEIIALFPELALPAANRPMAHYTLRGYEAVALCHRAAAG